MISLESLRELAFNAFPDTARPTVIHLLVAWGRHDDGELSGYLSGSGLDPSQFAEALEPLLGEDDAVDRELVIAAVTKADEDGILAVHLLKALLDRPGHRLFKLLASAGLGFSRLGENIAASTRKRPALAAMGVDLPVGHAALPASMRDLTRLAGEGAFDELAALPEQLARLEDVLLRKRKGNPILTGLPGVGKSALVGLLARDIVTNAASPLTGYRLYEVSMGALVAGTKYRGEFEARFEQVLQTVRDFTPSILFIDEIHLLLGAGRAEGAVMDGANLIKPHMTQDGIRVIGATTGAEYQRYIARDEALARRFQEIRLEEPAPEILEAMVRRQAAVLGVHHGLPIGEGVVQEAVALTDRYLPNRRQPDKSIDLLDSAFVAARRTGRQSLEARDLRETLARMADLPIRALTDADRDQLQNLAARLKKRVIGQDAAVEKVARGLIQRRLALGNENRPLGVFLFVGDTGVGKTELALAVAAAYFNDPRRIVRIDLAEYSAIGSVNKLIGAPRGFVGSEEGGALTVGLKTWPSCVILFDELEKAHPEVHRFLLGLLDTGRITNALGDVFDVRQSVVIMTTNAVTAKDLERKSIGFLGSGRDGDLAEILSASFPGEFLGRLDEAIAFQRLDDAAMRTILRLRLAEAEDTLVRKGIRLEYGAAELMDILMRRFRERRKGARGLARLLEREVLQPLALRLLDIDGAKGATVRLDAAFFRKACADGTG